MQKFAIDDYLFADSDSNGKPQCSLAFRHIGSGNIPKFSAADPSAISRATFEKKKNVS